jgi:hypothetical protein
MGENSPNLVTLTLMNFQSNELFRKYSKCNNKISQLGEVQYYKSALEK